MNWYVGPFCQRLGCKNTPSIVRLMKHTQYKFVYPFTLCFDCSNFLNLKDNKIGMNYAEN